MYTDTEAGVAHPRVLDFTQQYEGLLRLNIVPGVAVVSVSKSFNHLWLPELQFAHLESATANSVHLMGLMGEDA